MAAEGSELTCARHGVTTRLRCSQCGDGICPECMVHTDVGLRCPDDAHGIDLPRPSRAAPRRRSPLAWVGVAVGLAAVLGGAWALTRGSERTGTAQQPGVGAAGPSVVSGTTPQIWVSTSTGSDAGPLTSRAAIDHANPAWSPGGTDLAFESVVGGRRSIWAIGADGSRLRQVSDGTGDSHPAWNPAGGQIAFASDRDGDTELYLVNQDGSNLRQITDNDASDTAPSWSPDGTRIAFVSDRDGIPQLWSINPDGSDATLIHAGEVVADRPSWHPDGTSLAVTVVPDGGGSAVVLVDLAGGQVTTLASSAALDGEATIAPDGTRIAFASNRSGAPSVWVVDISGGQPVQVTGTTPAYAPAWSPDGERLAYVRDPG